MRAGNKFESSGAVIGSEGVRELIAQPKIKYLSRNDETSRGVYSNDKEVLRKTDSAARGKPVDGHAPGLSGDALKKYVSAAFQPIMNVPQSTKPGKR